MNRPLIRHASPVAAAREEAAAPALRLNPFAAAVRTSILALACTALPAIAQLPTGNNTVVGTAGVTSDGTTMSINQGSDFAQINWATFDVGDGQAVEITQQANDFLLNQVIGGGGASQIDGRISGPNSAATLGQVAIINQAGVLIGSTGVINVGGLIAGSLAISNIAVTGGNGQGQETNGSQGPETITLGGGSATNSVSIAAGGSVTAGAGGVLLVGRTVSNGGTIASGGPVQLLGAGGATVAIEEAANEDTTMRAPPTVDSSSLVERSATGGGNAVANSGTITAPDIRLEANVAPGLLNVVNNSGTLSATAIATDANGTVRLIGVGGGVQTGTVTVQGNGAGVGTIIASATDASESNGNVTVGDLDTGSTGSVSIEASHQILDDGDAGAADATTASLTATAGTGIDLQTSVGDLTASVTGTGNLIVDEIGGGITLTNVETAAGDLAVSAQGDIVATSVAATGGSATLQSTVEDGNITATSVSGTGVSLIADALDIGGTVDAGTGVALLRPTTNGTAISLGTEEVGQLSLTGAELDNITAGQITVGSSESGDLTVNESISTANTATLNLVSGGSISTAATKTITETTLTASAATGVDLDTDVSTLDASVSGTGAISIDEADGLTLRTVSAANGDVTVTTTSGSITAGSVSATGNTVNLTAAAGSIVDDGDASGLTSITADTVNLTVVDGGTVGANTGSGTIPANYLDLAGTPTIALTGNASSAHVQLVTTGTVTSSQTGGLVASGRDIGIAVSDGDFSFDDASFAGLGDGNLEVVANGVGLDHDTDTEQEILTTGNVLLRARTSAITDASDTSAAVDITANELTLDAVTGISADTTVADLDASIAGAGAGGTLSITETDGITLSDVDHVNGNIAIAAGGPISATAVEATGGDVSLTATGAGNGIATTFVSGTAVTLNAAGAVTGTGVAATDLDVTGASIDLGTTVQNLNASASSGTLKITEADDITLTDVDTSNGSIDIAAAGAITATDVAATGGNVTLTATGTDNGISTTAVSGTTVSLNAAGAVTGTGVSATDLDVTGASIDLVTSVQNLNASASSGTLTITEADGITLTDVDNSNGSIDITAAGPITATDVAATGGNVALTATGAGNGVATTTVSGATVTLTAPGAITGSGVSATDLVLSGGSISLGTSVDTLTATATDGDLTVTESNGITLSEVTTSANGNILVTANAGNIVAGVVDAGTGNVTLDADQVGTQQIRDDVSGSLDATTVIAGNTITLLAGGGIGAGSEDIDIDGTSLVAQTTTGALNINEANSVTLTTVTNGGAGDVALSTGSAQTTSAINAGTHNLRLETRDDGADLTVGGTLSGGTVTLLSGGAIIDGNATNPDVQATTLNATATSGIDLDTAVGSVSASGGAGAISLDQATGNLTLTSVSNSSGGITVNVANGALGVTSVSAGGGGSATLDASGAITGSDGTNVTAQSLSASSGDGGIELNTTVANLSLTAGGTGGIDIDNSTAVTLNNVTTAAGNIRVDAAAGNLTVGTVTAGTGGNVSLIADGAGQSIRDDGDDGSGPTRVTGNLVTLTAGVDIGAASEDLDTAAGTISATANGVINIDQAGDVVLNVDNPDGTTSATASGSLALNSDSDLTFGTVRGDGVDIESGGDIFIGDGGQIDGRDGMVNIAAAGDVTQAVGVNPAVSGDTISVVAGGKVGLPNSPLTVDAGTGAVVIQFSDDNAVAFVSGVFGSLNESPRVLGLGSNTVLANNVGAIQSSFEERVSFKLDSSQFATDTRIFSVEGTGVLPPEDQRE